MSVLDRSKAPSPAPVREFNFPEVTRAALANDLTILSARHGDLPVVTLLIVAHAGADHDTRATAGLAYLVTRALEAGTGTRSADRIAWEFELLGATLEVATLWDCAVLSVTLPAQNTEAALGLLAELVTAPAFRDEEIERLKTEQLAELEQRKAEPRSLANDLALRFIFAPDVPYARPIVGTPPSVRHLTTQHVRDFFTRHWTAGNAALIAVGDVDTERIVEIANRHLGTWSTGAAESADFDVASVVERAQIFIIDREGSVQSEIRVGHPGAARATPDFFALTIANGILGGVFTSRLNMSLREKHGYTYGVRSGFAFRKKAGPFIVQTAVASDVTARAVSELLYETRTLLQGGATEEEVIAAREYLAGVMPLEMQTTDQMADRIADTFIYGLANDYLPQHRSALLSVTPAEANRAAQAHIRPAEFAITIVGDAKAIENDLAALNIGPIEVHSAND